MKKQLIKLSFCLISIVWVTSCSQGMGFSEVDPAAAATFASESYTWNQSVQKVDILVVVDNSTSMSAEQKKMADRIGSFLSKLGEVDWQLGITTTDVSNGKFGIKGSLLPIGPRGEHYLTSETSRPDEHFKKHIQRKESSSCYGDCPSSTEEPLRASIMAMSKHETDNRGFFREGSQLAVVVISDEDEKSSGSSSATKPRDVINQAKLYLGPDKNITGYGIVIQPWDSECLEKQKAHSMAHYGTHVQNLADLTGGLTGSLCDADYANSLAAIGQDTRQKLRSIKLSYFPIEDTIEIQFVPAHSTGWHLEGKNIYFDDPPPNGTQILVDYEKPSYGG